MRPTTHGIMDELTQRGFALASELGSMVEFRALAANAGVVVAEEPIQLREAAHAYVARPGPVPLHTDHPQVEIAAWFCVEQDKTDGATLLLDASPVLASYTADDRALLKTVKVVCPLVAGGPPRQRFPVLRPSPSGANRELLFCSPWLDAADSIAGHQEALTDLRSRLGRRAASDLAEVRLQPGQALFVDNQRVLHGRRRIGKGSHRHLHRLWLITHETAALE